MARDSRAAACTPIFVLCFCYAERENLESRYNTEKNQNLFGFLVNCTLLKKKWKKKITKENEKKMILYLNVRASTILFQFGVFIMLCNFQKVYLDLQSDLVDLWFSFAMWTTIWPQITRSFPPGWKSELVLLFLLIALIRLTKITWVSRLSCLFACWWKFSKDVLKAMSKQQLVRRQDFTVTLFPVPHSVLGINRDCHIPELSVFPMVSWQ